MKSIEAQLQLLSSVQPGHELWVAFLNQLNPLELNASEIKRLQSTFRDWPRGLRRIYLTRADADDSATSDFMSIEEACIAGNLSLLFADTIYVTDAIYAKDKHLVHLDSAAFQANISHIAELHVEVYRHDSPTFTLFSDLKALRSLHIKVNIAREHIIDHRVDLYSLLHGSAQKLIELSITDWSGRFHSDLFVGMRFDALTQLRLDVTQLDTTDDDVEFMRGLLEEEALGALKHLYLSLDELADTWLRDDPRQAKPLLTSLYLAVESPIGLNTFRALMSHSSLRELKKLTLVSVFSDTEEAKQGVEVLAQSPCADSLESLTLTHLNLTKTHTPWVYPPNLSELNLVHSVIDRDLIVALLQSALSLKRLLLGGLDFGNFVAQSIVNSPLAERLECLMIYLGQLDDAGLEQLLTASSLSHLTELYLDHNELTDTSAHLWRGASNLSNLMTLSLNENRGLGDATLESIVQSSCLSDLRHLNFRNRSSRDCLLRLQKLQGYSRFISFNVIEEPQER